MLYELLTGTTPFDRETVAKANFDDLRRMIREQEPPRPSARVATLKAEARTTLADRRRIDQRRVSDELRGELDWIVMKSLEKDRSRRYESASAFAADVQRYLDDEPVLACPPSNWYWLSKLVRRRRVLVGTSALVFTSLLLGLVGTSIQTVRAWTAEALAQESLANERVARTKADIQRDRADQERRRADKETERAQQANARRFERSRQSGCLNRSSQYRIDDPFSWPGE